MVRITIQVALSNFGVQWATKQLRCNSQHSGIALFIPPPHVRLALVHDAIKYAAVNVNTVTVVLVPVAAYADTMWQSLFTVLHKITELPLNLSIYTNRAVAGNATWCNPIAVETRPKWRWCLWQVVTT